ncbi:hypothetical protein HYN56_00980 [Flavobacterium crocinum]|uniref:Uncharacterized protein n=1 Tax=Flavobacterium crocinum TaxID=2183896 RepID=A0A2S1YFQ0_9FLAO|nr:hypothetical protein [Flavobacterium crocinum]AWK02861.1 hypothetical protein HYN56_00980 [Flavobacterium crocinum]
MGLDMRPLGKPKPGFENRFKQIMHIIQGKEKQELSFFDKLKGKKVLSKEELLEEWFENQIQSYETIKAPRVGYDQIANDWIRERYNESDKELSEEDFLKEYNGFYVIELSKEPDAVPIYRAMGQDENVFRGQFLSDCVDVIGEDLVNEAWDTKFADEALDYGNRLMEKALKIARENNLEYLKNEKYPPENADETSIESKLHIAFSLAKWLIFYGKNGHGYEADF